MSDQLSNQQMNAYLQHENMNPHGYSDIGKRNLEKQFPACKACREQIEKQKAKLLEPHRRVDGDVTEAMLPGQVLWTDKQLHERKKAKQEFQDSRAETRRIVDEAKRLLANSKEQSGVGERGGRSSKQKLRLADRKRSKRVRVRRSSKLSRRPYIKTKTKSRHNIRKNISKNTKKKRNTKRRIRN